jgi:hypothetical protein
MDRYWRKQIIREARAAASLDHPGILPVLETGTIRTIRYIATAYCDGPNLHKWMSAKGKVPIKLACELVADVADAVQHAHSRGILHRDIKPANILLRVKDGERDLERPIPQLTDFGLARPRVLNEEPSALGPVGTPAYMAPEVASGSTTNGGVPADIYSLGVVLHELIFGSAPSEKRTVSSTQSSVNGHSPERHDLPRDIAAIVKMALHEQPAMRYQSAEAMANDLRAFLDGRPVVARPVGKVEALTKLCRRHPAYAAMCAALIVAVAAGLTGIVWQWKRAEAGFRKAQSEASRANENRLQAEAAVIYMTQALDEANLWRMPGDWRSDANVERLCRYYDRFMNESLGNEGGLRPIAAAARCYRARVLILGGEKSEGLRLFRESLRMWHTLLAAAPHDAVVRDGVANTCLYFGGVLKNEFGMREGLFMVEDGRLLGEFPLANELGRLVARDYRDLLEARAHSLRRGGRIAEADDLDAARAQLIAYFEAQLAASGGLSEVARGLDITAFRASHFLNEGPERAFDGQLSTQFISRTFPPAWIEVDLQERYDIHKIALVTQGSALEIQHRVFVSDKPMGEDLEQATLVCRFAGQSHNGHRLEGTFVPARGRYVQIRTDKCSEWVAWQEIEVYGSRPEFSAPAPTDLPRSISPHRHIEIE